MTYDDIIRIYRTNHDAAAALGVTRSCLSHWKKFGIPRGRQKFIELQTRGKLKCDPEFKL